MEVSDILRTMRYLAVAEDKKLFIIDNLKGLDLNERAKANGFMKALQALCLELQITVILLSHVAKDKYQYQAYVSTSPKNKDLYETQTAEDMQQLIKRPGMEWESGRMPSKENIDGHSVISDLADYVFALARHTTSEDDTEQRTLRVKALKTRLDGSKAGTIFKLYHQDNGRLVEKGFSNPRNDEVF